ncbi:MAG: hypothetical protein GXZ11_07285 [Tissierellia bacterium]|nr:hypothetical protein [Tissierellia bacterium]
MKEKNIVVGLNQVKKHIRKKSVDSVCVAKDADWSIKLILEEMCKDYEISMNYFPSKYELGKKAGINVPTATVARLI